MDEERILTPLEQLTEYCDCTDIEERDVNELISLISTYTCWAQKPCETFLTSERREVKDLPDCVNECDIYRFTPFFAPFEKDSFTFTLVEQNGISEISTPVTSYIYSEADGEFRLELPLPSCKCRPDPCGCKSSYKLVITYVAGYPNIPECLLPMFCDAVYWLHQKNKCDCEECDACGENGTFVTDGRHIDYTTLEGRLQDNFLAVFTHQYFNQLSLISLCRRQDNVWGVVV